MKRNVAISEETRTKLKIEAAKEKRTMAEILEELIEKWLDKKGVK